MATIYKRLTEDGRVRYTAYIRLKGHPKQSQTFDRKADAIRWAKQHETAVQTGRYLLSPELPPEALGAGASCRLPCVTAVSLRAQIRGKQEV